ncbi:M20 family metallopeptidase [Sphingomonas sp.]|uniref:M20 family metallopeptidase n=1 Tax=Sphingomonas sp. TaxID=28214 RepID=UPI002CB7D593|nr:M20/M25/M40 family metallo-hydrolase [Sphingomonas sp.]HWK36051.1 M20/M25/M40 family metallo-hydrolase [Sphingomonas sp.]
MNIAVLGLSAMLCAALLPGGANARDRSLAQVTAAPDTRAVLKAIDDAQGDTNRRLVAIGGIISPSGQEQARAAAVKAEMEHVGLTQVTQDARPNVVGVIKGRSGRALVFVSTLDDLATVADHQRAAGVPPRIEGDRIIGPGTNTGSTVVAMLAAAEALIRSGIKPEHDLVFAAVAQEETGLDGMRALYPQYRDRAVAFVDILGDGDSISYGAIGIHWWKVTAKGPPGHTLMGGLPNVNQGIGRAVDRILSLPDPTAHADSNTRLNISILNSGAVFNHKPESGWFSIDLRSLDGAVIAGIERRMWGILDQVTAETGIGFDRAVENEVPAGQIPGALASPLVRWSAAIAQSMGRQAKLSNAGSANLNIAIAGGTPAIGIGGERGGQRGFADEWADVGVLNRTAKHVALLALTVGNGDGFRGESPR